MFRFLTPSYLGSPILCMFSSLVFSMCSLKSFDIFKTVVSPLFTLNVISMNPSMNVIKIVNPNSQSPTYGIVNSCKSWGRKFLKRRGLNKKNTPMRVPREMIIEGRALSMNDEGKTLYTYRVAKAAIIESPISKKVSFDLCPSKISPINRTERTNITVRIMFHSLVTQQYKTI